MEGTLVVTPHTRPQAAAPANFRQFLIQPYPTCCLAIPYSQIPKRAAEGFKRYALGGTKEAKQVEWAYLRI
jgi:hypothetical protein